MVVIVIVMLVVTEKNRQMTEALSILRASTRFSWLCTTAKAPETIPNSGKTPRKQADYNFTAVQIDVMLGPGEYTIIPSLYKW
jgi:hypothetical protein